MQRRSFVQWVVYCLGAAFAGVMGIPGVAFLLDPRNRAGQRSGSFKTVGRLSDLQVGKPKEEVIVDMHRDAWILNPNDVVGRVWLVRREDGRVDAFSSVCPHLGCSIDFDEKEKRFICPCHNAQWAFDGKRLDTVSPPIWISSNSHRTNRTGRSSR